MAALGRALKNTVLIVLSPFIGLVFVILLPFIGLAMLAWMGARAWAGDRAR